MSYLLDVLAKVALQSDSTSVSNEHLAPCIQPGQPHDIYEKLDDFGEWTYWLLTFDADCKLTFMRDKNGWCIWCPVYSYGNGDAIVNSLVHAINLHNCGIVEFSDQAIICLNLKNPFYYFMLLKVQMKIAKNMEIQTSMPRQDIDLFLELISQRKRLIRERISALLEQ